MTSRPELKLDTQPTEPPRRPRPPHHVLIESYRMSRLFFITHLEACDSDMWKAVRRDHLKHSLEDSAACYHQKQTNLSLIMGRNASKHIIVWDVLHRKRKSMMISQNRVRKPCAYTCGV